jgi:hypothetical protein
MRMSPFQRFIANLSDKQLASVLDGSYGIGCSDNDYCLVEGEGVAVDGTESVAELRSELSENEKEVLHQLYRNRPLCRAEFDHQARRLLREHGAANFCRHPGNASSWALMIDDSGLVAVGPEDVRSQYGYYCEGDNSQECDDAAAKVMRWLESGQAYEDYRSKTTCRYSC